MCHFRPKDITSLLKAIWGRTYFCFHRLEVQPSQQTPAGVFSNDSPALRSSSGMQKQLWHCSTGRARMYRLLAAFLTTFPHQSAKNTKCGREIFQAKSQDKEAVTQRLSPVCFCNSGSSQFLFVSSDVVPFVRIALTRAS